MSAIEAAHTVVGLLPHRRAGQTVQITTHKVAERVASESVATQQNDVDDQNDGAESDSEILVSGVSVEEPHRLVRIAGENDEKNQCGVQEVAVDVLDDERKESFTPVALSRLAHGTVGRIGPEALVIRAPVVVAGEAEPGGKGKNQQRW